MKLETHSILSRIIVSTSLASRSKEDYASHIIEAQAIIAGDKVPALLVSDKTGAIAATHLIQSAVHLILAADKILIQGERR